jgi:hypothetical protein
MSQYSSQTGLDEPGALLKHLQDVGSATILVLTLIITKRRLHVIPKCCYREISVDFDSVAGGTLDRSLRLSDYNFVFLILYLPVYPG